MTKRLVLAVCTVAAVFTAALAGTVATTLPGGVTTRITADGEHVVLLTAAGGTTTNGSGRPKPPNDTSWGG